jgi:hypothetical protein
MSVIIDGDTGIDKVQPGSVDGVDLTDGSVTEGKIGAGEVTQAKLASGVAGTGPAFSAYMSATQSLTTTTLTKVQFNTEDFDTDSCYDHTTNYRFTPNVAGYYQVNGVLTLIGTSGTAWVMQLYKNGSVIQYIGNQRSSGGEGGPSGSALVYMNGTTDYLEMYTLVVATSPSIYAASSIFNKFQAHLVRAA